ncbi:MAG TPA: N-acetylmuramoyl-L-alanine amidase, partial [Solirubrobacteraceae bacterium]
VRLPRARRIGPVRVPGGLELAGLRWPGAAHVHGELRARRRGGRWTPWLPLHGAGDHGPDGDAPLGGTDPVWTGRADEVELRLSRALHGLTLHGVRTIGAPRVIRARAAQSDTPPVRIITRTEWGGDSVPPRAAPELGEVRMAFVHHTVNANDYGPQDSAGIVLAICRYHRDHNKWNDLGYNFLVDRFGQVFEGRAGGIDQPVVGAQAQGYNSVSTGIGNIGTYDVAGQTPEALEAMASLIAWKLGIHGAPIEGQVTVTSRGGDVNRYPADQPVVFNRVAGHRDGDKTECPGAALYAQLPALRDRAAERQRAMGGPRPVGTTPRLTLAVAATRIWLPAEAQVTGALLGTDGVPMAGAPVSLQVEGSRAWVTVARVTTAADGTFGATVPVHRNTRVRAHFGGRGSQPAASTPVGMTVVPALSAHASTRRVRAGGAVRVSVAVSPYRPRVVLAIGRQLPGGQFVPAGTVRARVRSGSARATVRLRRPGLYRIVAQAPADRRAEAASAPWVFVRAVRR